MITTTLQGRCGNNFYILAMLLAYAKKHNLEYHIPNIAYHCDGRKMYFPNLAMGPEIQGFQEYHELQVHASPKGDGTFDYNTPEYRDIPKMDNVKFVGYWQSFKYFDWCRDYILEKFNLEYEERTGAVGIHLRFGDFLQLRDKHPEIPVLYYQKAVAYFIKQGYNFFSVHTDDMERAKRLFKDNDFPDADFTFSIGYTEVQDIEKLSHCEHQILCYSTFGFISAWLNRNPDKQIIIPPKRFVFSGSNKDFIADYFTPLEFE